MSDVTLHLGDCLEYMRGMDSGSVDAVVTDPPYGINYNPGYKELNKWMVGDNKKFDPSPFIRYSKFVLLFGANYYSDKLPLGGWVIWDKRVSDKADAMFGKPGEMAWCNIPGELHIIRVQHGGVVNADYIYGLGKQARVHPSQKPVSVMYRIIKRYTSPGDTIFDPFMGSGTTGVAAVQLGRKFIGCEIDPGYFEIAQKRIAEAQKQPPLFTETEPRPKPKQAGFQELS